MASRPADFLALEARRRLYQHVRQYPGLHLREIARGAGLDPNHAKYHLQYLGRHGLVSSRREGGYWRFFALEPGPLGLQEVLNPRDKVVLALLRRPIPLHVVLLLLDRGQASVEELTEAVGVGRGTLHYHLKKMEAADAVVSKREGRKRIYALADPGYLLGQVVRYRPPGALVQGFLEAWEQLDIP